MSMSVTFQAQDRMTVTFGPTQVIQTGGLVDLSGFTTDDLNEGSANQYYTNARVDTRAGALITTRLGALTSDNIPEGSSNLYFTDARADARVTAGLAGLSTDNISEGSNNLYFTAARVNALLPGVATSSQDGLFTSAGFTKLAGIEVNAKDDQTGSEIVTLINTQLGGSTWQTGGGGGGGSTPTDLALGTRTTTTMVITSSSGQNVTVPASSATQAGLESSAHFASAEQLPPVWSAASYSIGDQVLWDHAIWHRISAGTDTTATSSRPGSNAAWARVVHIPNTDSLSEGSSNLYFTNTRADARFDVKLAAATTDNLDEGSSNLYYTDARTDARIALAITNTALNVSTPANESTTIAPSRRQVATAIAAVPSGGGGGTVAATKTTTNQVFVGQSVPSAGAADMTTDFWYRTGANPTGAFASNANELVYKDSNDNLHFRDPLSGDIFLEIDGDPASSDDPTDVTAIYVASIAGSGWISVPLSAFGGSGGGATNLSLGTRTATSLVIASSSGNDVTLPLADSALSGLMSPAHYREVGNFPPSWTSGNDYLAGRQISFLGEVYKVRTDITNSTTEPDSDTAHFDRLAGNSQIPVVSDAAINVATPANESTTTVPSRQSVAEAIAAVPSGGGGGGITDLSSFTTTDLAEGNNLYFTNARADARIALAITNTAIDTSDPSTESATIAASRRQVAVAVAAAGSGGGSGGAVIGDRIDLGNSGNVSSNTWYRITFSQAVTDDSILVGFLRSTSGNIRSVRRITYVPGKEFNNTDTWTTFSNAPSAISAAGINQYEIIGNIVYLARGANSSEIWCRQANAGGNYRFEFDLYPLSGGGSGGGGITDLSSFDTDNLVEGANNLYFTDARVNALLPGVATASQDGLMSSANFTKVEGIEANAKDDQTGAEIVSLLDTELGSDTWQQGGGTGGGAGGTGGVVIQDRIQLGNAAYPTIGAWQEIDLSENVPDDSIIMVYMRSTVSTFLYGSWTANIIGKAFNDAMFWPETVNTPTSTSATGVNRFPIRDDDVLYLAKGENGDSIWVNCTFAGTFNVHVDIYPLAGGSGTGGGGTTPVVITDTMYWAVRTDQSFTAADFTGADGTSATGTEIELPTYTGNRYHAIAVPFARGLPTDIRQEMSPFNEISSFTRQSGTTDIGGDPHYIFISNDVFFDSLSGSTWQVT